MIEKWLSIGKSKGHDQKLIVTIVTMKSYFGDVLVPYSDLMVPQVEINLEKYLAP